MNVEELMEILSELDPKKRLIFRAFEGTAEDLEQVSEVRVDLYKYRERYCGPHRIDKDGETEAYLLH